MPVNHLGPVRCFLFDLDGTLYLDGRLLPGANEVFNFLKSKKLDFRFITNNSSKSRDTYLQKLTSLGLPASPENIITSGQVTIDLLLRQFPGRKVALLGTPDLTDEFARAEIPLVETDPDMLVLSYDTTLTYARIKNFCGWVRQGFPYIATHSDLTCPTSAGPVPDIGSFIALISAATGRKPDVIVGKPFQPLVDYLMQDTGLAVQQMAMIGDRMYTDIAMGLHGIFTVLVLTGETTMSDLPLAKEKPDLVVDNLDHFLSTLRSVK